MWPVWHHLSENKCIKGRNLLLDRDFWLGVTGAISVFFAEVGLNLWSTYILNVPFQIESGNRC